MLPELVQAAAQEPSSDAVPLEEACTSLQMRQPVGDMRQTAISLSQGQGITGQSKMYSGHVSLSCHPIWC